MLAPEEASARCRLAARPAPVAQGCISAAELERGAVRSAEHLALAVRQLSGRCRSTATPLHVRIQLQHAARAAEELERHLREARDQLDRQGP